MTSSLFTASERHRRQHVLRAIGSDGRERERTTMSIGRSERHESTFLMGSRDDALGEGSRMYLHLAFAMDGRGNTALMGGY